MVKNDSRFDVMLVLLMVDVVVVVVVVDPSRLQLLLLLPNVVDDMGNVQRGFHVGSCGGGV